MIKILLKVLTSNLVVLSMKLVSGFLFPILMTTQAYANYQTFALYLSYITILHLGFPTGMFVNYGGQHFEQIDKGRYKSEVHILLGILGFFTLLFAATWLFIRDRTLLYITICIIPYCMVSSYQSLYQAWGEFGRFARTQVVTLAVPLLGAAFLYFIFHELPAEYYIYLFIAVHLIYTAEILRNAKKSTRGAVRAPYFDDPNWKTLKIGFSICLGNYINVLFHSVDKQFVKIIFDTTSFAVYSFGLSLQTIMMVFITSVAQPMFNFLASGRVEEKQYKMLKQILLMFGACSGIAYHACRLVVAWLVPAYNASMEVAATYFLAFPAMAVINCMYINLYKLTRQSKQYVCTLGKVLLLSVALNGILVLLWRQISSITMATVAVYYIWLLMDGKRFASLKIEIRDILFLAGYFAVYFLTLNIVQPVWAALGYMLLLLPIGAAAYGRTMRFVLHMALGKVKKMGLIIKKEK